MSGPGGRIDRDDALPLYEQLAHIIASKISGGKLAPGKRLPTELDLARDYSVSRETVRHAIGILERRGLVIRRRAKGTFVAASRVSQDLAQLRSFRGGLVDRGVVPEMELLEFRLAEPPKEFAAAFAEREVMRLLRRYVVKRKPLAIADIYLHPMAKAISWEIAERHDTYAIFGEFLSMPVVRAAATIRADVAGRTIGRLLDLRPSDAVLVLIQTHYAASGEVLVRSALYVRADAYELHIDMLGGAPSRTVSPVRLRLISRGGAADGTYTDASGRGGKRDRHNIGVVRLRSLQCDVGSRLQQDILSLIRPARRYAAGIPHLRRRHGSAAGRRHHLRPAWRSHRTPSDADRDGQYHGRARRL